MRLQTTGRMLIATAGLSIAAWSAQAAVVFTENFEDGTVAAEFSSPTSTLAVDTAPNGQRFLGRADTSNRGLNNDTVLLGIATPAAHTSATLEFDLYVINSMDGSEPFSITEATAGALLNAVCSNVFGVVSCFTPAPDSPEATNTLGFAPLNPGVTAADAIYHFILTFAHSDASIDLNFTYSLLQDLADESWGIDNVVVSIDAAEAPAPATLLLLGIGLAGLTAAARRARRAPALAALAQRR